MPASKVKCHLPIAPPSVLINLMPHFSANQMTNSTLKRKTWAEGVEEILRYHFAAGMQFLDNIDNRKPAGTQKN